MTLLLIIDPNNYIYNQNELFNTRCDSKHSWEY